MAALFGGSGKPNWQELFESVKLDLGEWEDLSVPVNGTMHFGSMSTLETSFQRKRGW